MSAELETGTPPGAGRAQPGLPGSGSRARSRELGYSEAMRSMFCLVSEMERGVTSKILSDRDPLDGLADALSALAQIREYTFEAYQLGSDPGFAMDRLEWQWKRAAPVEM